MKKLLIYIFFLNFYILYGQEFQFAVIHDNDGFVNIRSSKSLRENNIIDRLENGFVVTHFGSEGNWINIDYQKDKKDLNGYIYFNRVNEISKFKEIQLKNKTKDEVLFSNDKIEVKIECKTFDKTKHSYEYYKSNPNQLYKIDNKDIFGTDGNLPKREYKRIQIKIDKLTFELPKIALENLYEPNIESTLINFDKKTDILFIQSLNSDGAGGYAILWIIEKGKYLKRITAIPF
jgi:hypothetical protein